MIFSARDYDAEIDRWMTKDPIKFADGLKSLYEYIGNDGYNPSPFRESPVTVDELKSKLEGSVEGQLNRMNVPERCKCENEY